MTKNVIMKKIITRAKAPIPKFFKVLRNVGLALAAVGGTILAAPIALPAIVTTIGGYVAVAGGVLSAASQLTTTGDNIIRQAQDDKSGNGQ
jgi:uncharacterized membrane protein HdeD (DUF308 family)